LALYYNRDLLNSAGIAKIPSTWSDFQKAVIRLTKFDAEGSIIQSGAALGTSNNVERPFDILSVLMLQNGVQMADENGWARFNEGDSLRLTEEALTFYTDFANPVKEVYCWDKEMPNALNAFAQGKTAFFIGYSYHLPLIRARAPKLNFSISQLPQVGGGQEINYANYWVEVVSKKSENVDFSWDFVQFASDVSEVQHYLSAAKRPTALRGLIEQQLQDLDLGIFASQVLTAKNWYRGNDANKAEEAFNDLIDSVFLDVKIREAIDLAAAKINQTMR
jgi:ABC-type glycerol-3-phosphate transport system substrate-binding protein